MSDNHKAALIADALTKQVHESSKPKVAYVVLQVSSYDEYGAPVAVFHDENTAVQYAESISDPRNYLIYDVITTPIM